MFKCKLKIEGINQKLSYENGLSLKDLGEIISLLSKCLEVDNIKFTLTGVDNTSYTPVIETEEDIGVDKFNLIHNNILNNSIDELTEEEQEYAKSLNKLLFTKGIYLTALNDRDNSSIEIKTITRGAKRNFTSYTTITGKIVSIVGKNEEKPYITVQTSQGKDYKILIKPEQEKTISKFYKEYNIKLRVAIKIDSWEHKEIESKLLDYIIPEKKSLLQTIDEIKKEYGDIFLHIADSAKLIRQYRNENE